MIRHSLRHDYEIKFLDHILHQCAGVGPNEEAMAIFQAIQHCFDGASGEDVVINSYLLHNLASCAWVSLQYNASRQIPWDKGDHDYVILRAYRGFITTLMTTIREGRCTIREDGTCRLSAFPIPAWFVERAKKSH